LLPGEVAILFLQRDATNPEVFRPQGFIGVNRIQDGFVYASKRSDEDLDEQNAAPARKGLDGRPVTDVIEVLKQASEN
jgi:hypothetical protein